MTRWLRSAFFPIWPATVLLILLSPLLARGALSESAVIGMVPFAAILAVASVGQTLVIQQRGLDLSLPGMLSLATVIVTKVPAGDPSLLPLALILVMAASVAAGLLNGLAITRFRITPLVATLGVNAVLVGTVLALTSGTSTASSSMALSSFALARTFGVPNTALVAILLIAVVTVVVNASVIGRRFVAVGANPTAAYAAGIPVSRYLIATYVAAGCAYGLAGVLLTGFLGIPGPLPGDNYLLPSIAAVVLGGTSLAGGAGSVAATAAGAVFLTQLGLLVRAMGAPASVQLIISGAIIALGMALRLVPWRRLLASAALRRHSVPEGGEP
jgi:ribose transport system permease protein